MKFAAIFCLSLTLLAASASASALEYDRDYLLKRQDKFRRMKTTGLTLGIIGSVMAVGGIILAANGEWETQENMNGGTQANAKDGAAGGGLFLLITGIPLGVTGFVLGGIGSSKVKRYQDLLDDARVGLLLGPDRRGAVIAYSF